MTKISDPVLNKRTHAFRFPTTLIAHAREIAHAEGTTLSAFVRQAVSRNIQAYIANERGVIRDFK